MEHTTLIPTGGGGYREATKATREPSHIQVMHTIWKPREYHGKGVVPAPERLPAPQWIAAKSETRGTLLGEYVYPVGCVGVYPTEDKAVVAAKGYNKTLTRPAILLVYHELYQPPVPMKERVLSAGRRLVGRAKGSRPRLTR
jgi:hypothetical protein